MEAFPDDPDIARIPLSRGMVATVDADDAERLLAYKWHAKANRRKDTHTRMRFYAVTTIDGKDVAMHALLMDPPPGMLVDHADHDGLNNRRSNLRIASRAQNGANTEGEPRASSGFYGVSWDKRTQRWAVKVTTSRKYVFNRTFSDPEAAARTRDYIAKSVWGPFARLNFPEASN